MTRIQIPHYLCDKCGTQTQSTGTPEGWLREVVWTLYEEWDWDDLTHTAHDRSWHRVDSHLCSDCWDTADSFVDDFDGSSTVDACSWCETDDIIGELGSAAGGLDEWSYGICLECSPFERAVSETETRSVGGAQRR